MFNFSWVSTKVIDNNIVQYDLISRVPIHQLQLKIPAPEFTIFGGLVVVLYFYVFYPWAANLDKWNLSMIVTSILLEWTRIVSVYSGMS